MAKFIKFRIDNANALTGGLGQRDVLLDVSKIESISDVGAATSVVITLSEYVGLASALVAGADPVSGTAAAGTVGGRILTLTLGNSTNQTTGAEVAPTVPSVYQNMPSQSINRALTANPGGVSSQVQLALDGGGVRGVDSQMYFVQAAFSSSNTI
tara:strand:+ start:3154 stop:3618 length:465 start_codon:yes stop_codon:yes gene_type:complete